ncbi:MAG TPA: YiiX/YebB-like N1pC/P60 family cysteine hydrolase [Flavipsychrobacter sp.]
MKRYLSITILITIIGSSCSNTPDDAFSHQYNLQPGDILFQDLDCGPACDAIESVTEGVNGMDFSHCGIVAEIDGELKVVEAYGSVQAVPVDSFLARSRDDAGKPKVVIGRTGDKALATQSAELSKNYMGKAYDNAFAMDDDAYYCSELVYECYKRANGGEVYFPLNTMTFKLPGTDTFMPFWTEYYHKLGMEIPEGDSGINPGAISRSERLQIIELNKQ